jgi:hypothetical protein
MMVLAAFVAMSGARAAQTLYDLARPIATGILEIGYGARCHSVEAKIGHQIWSAARDLKAMKVHKLTFVAAVLLCLLGAPAPGYAQLEPDKKIASVGKWSISTARFVTGCVAHLDYDDGYDLSIGGESFDRLTLLITVRSKWFSSKLDGTEEHVPSIEIVLANNRWGNVQPYGYRGTPGVVLTVDNAFLGSFVGSEKIKVTELGREKLSIDLENPGQVIDALRACFKSGGTSSTSSLASERDVTCHGKLVDTSESSFRVGVCGFVRESNPVILATCSKYTKDHHFLGNLYCVVKARVNENNQVTRVYSVQAKR